MTAAPAAPALPLALMTAAIEVRNSVSIDLGAMLVWGFVATMALTSLSAAGQGLHLSRMSMPFLLGTIVSGRRDRARWLGGVLHFVAGWLFAVPYVAVFEAVGAATWWGGAALGLLQAASILTVVMPLLPAIHPRMADADQGPDPTRRLEPPGFLALNYGHETPLVVMVAHIVYGAILGAFYPVG
ncbi:MAG: hypothetical protein R6X25_07635 [Candidatus Krumholzibacteriia bacterium]